MFVFSILLFLFRWQYRRLIYVMIRFTMQRRIRRINVWKLVTSSCPISYVQQNGIRSTNLQLSGPAGIPGSGRPVREAMPNMAACLAFGTTPPAALIFTSNLPAASTISTDVQPGLQVYQREIGFIIFVVYCDFPSPLEGIPCHWLLYEAYTIFCFSIYLFLEF